MNATQVSKDPHECRSNSRRRLLTAGLIAGVVAVLSGVPAMAGSSTDAEITDVAGDANFISAVTADERDTRPVSSDNADLRAVWFETAYSTSKVLDPGTGTVLRVEYRPTALVVKIQTQGPVRPLSPWGSLRFKVPVTVPACSATLELLVATNPAADSAEIRPAAPSTSCGEDPPVNIVISPVKPTYDGAVSAVTFPLAHEGVSKVISPGTVLSQTRALVTAGPPAGSAIPTPSDQTASGRNFTIGQDVPPDVDCTATPNNTECQS
ncbi:MAG: hypothetical protein ACRDHM_02140 [Actinomycetota bacterium]